MHQRGVFAIMNGKPYAEDYTEYSEIGLKELSADGGRRKVYSGNRRISNVMVAYPENVDAP